MEFLVGIALALLVCVAAAWLGMDRDRVFYPAVLIATATYYVAFAVIDRGAAVMIAELALSAIFIGLAVFGFKRSPWLVVAGLAGHAILDVFHDGLVHNTGVPPAWPGFCMTFDLAVAALVGWMLWRRAREEARQEPGVRQ